MTNAIQAVRAKAVEATKRRQSYQPEIRIDVNQTAKSLIVVVADNGVGMSAEVCRRAFEPLYTTRAQGTGIGLAIVEKIARYYTGRVFIEETCGGGATFWVELEDDKGSAENGT